MSAFRHQTVTFGIHRPRARHLLVMVALACLVVASGRLSAQTEAPSLDALFKKGADAYNRGKYDVTIASFEQIIKLAKPGPQLEPVYFAIATAKLRKPDYDGAIDAYQRYLKVYPSGAQINDARAGLTKALIEAKRMPEAMAAIRSLRNLRSNKSSQGIDNYASLLGLTLDIADSLLSEKKTAEALDTLQDALSRDQIIERQRQRIADLDRLYQQAAATAASAKNPDSTVAANRDALAARLKDARDALKIVEDNAAFDIPRLLRQGQCYLELDKPWEALVVYDEILTRFPAAADRVYALRGLVFATQATSRVGDGQPLAGSPAARLTTERLKKTLDLCQRFIDEFGSSPFAAEVAALGGQIASQLNDNTKAASFFGAALNGSKGDQLERVIFQLGDTRFTLGDWAGSRKMFDRYVHDYPSGLYADNAGYRSAITWFLDTSDADRYAKAEKAIKAFVAQKPSSDYLSDAYYRLAVCLFAFQEYPKALAACEEWEKRFPNDGLLSEVLSLKGDVQKTMGNNDAALETYLAAAGAASSNDTLDYTLNEAGRLLEEKKDWARLSTVFSNQLDQQPDSKLAMGWYYWVARAKARSGGADDAWNFLADHVGVQMANPDNEDVEKILELMAQIRSRQRPPAGAPAAAPIEQLAERLALPKDAPPLVKARLNYYQARLLTLTRKPDEADKLMLATGRDMPPEKMSAALLAMAGEALYKSGDEARASAFFNALLDRFPLSNYRDYAYVGLGDLALDRSEPAVALKFYDDAVKKAGAVHRQREATVGQARGELALGHLDKANELFTLIASAKEWRGEATALSLYYMGEIAVKQGDLPKGIAFFQRVFVSQVRYPEWVAKSYIASGKAFEDLGKAPEAAATYREMLRNERLKDRPELAVARTRLQALDPASS